MPNSHVTVQVPIIVIPSERSESRNLGRVLLFVCLLAAVTLSPLYEVWAQSPLPGLQTLSISLWPEYDRPDVLVMYSGQLGVGVELPAQLTFRLPGYIENMHAVAFEQDGTLMTVDPATIEWTDEGDDVLLSFPSPSLGVHFEYYDPVIMNKQGQTRQIDYTLSVPYDIGTTIIEIQHPLQSEDVVIVPAPADTFIGGGGLEYSTVTVSNLAAGDTFDLSITYRRNTNELSAPNPSTGAPAQPGGAPAPATRSESSTLYYVLSALAGAGVMFLIFFWREKSLRSRAQARAPRRPSTRATTGPPSQRTLKRARRGKRGSGQGGSGPAKSTPPARAATTEQISLFCYQCGTALRENADFCHACGTRRRDS